MATPGSNIPPVGGDPSYHPTDPGFRPPRGWGRPLWRRSIVVLGFALVVLVELVLAGRNYLQGAAMRAKVQARVQEVIAGRLGGGTVGTDYSVDWLGRVRIGPVRLAGPHQTPVVEIGWIAVRPSYRALLAGKAEPASVLLHDVRVDAGPNGEKLRALLTRVRSSHPKHRSVPSVAAKPLPLVRFDTLTFSAGLPHLKQPVLIPLEGGRIELRRSVVGGELELRSDLQAGGRITAHASWTRDGPFTLDTALAGVMAAAIPDAVRAALPFHVSDGRLDAKVQLLAPAGFHRGSVQLSTTLSGVQLEGPRLADGPVGPMEAAFNAQVRWDTAWKRLTLEHGELAVGPNGEAKVALEGDLVLLGQPRFSVSAHVERLAYQAALDALPRALVPDEAPRLDGTMTASVAVSGPLHAPDAWKLDAKLDLSDLKQAARQRAPIYLKDPFEYRTTDAAGRQHAIWVGLKNRYFVPLSELPTYVYRAVTTSEDAGFFAHHGFDFDEIKNSIVADAEAGRAVRGGSTITQQLAKNLFLSRKKTYARKIREALITVALEASLPKQRLLEIYLNIIEWGPGIYGIGQAAQHYFGKPAQQLTPKEAAFLATIIPNPIRYSMYYERGALTDAWEKHVDDLLGKMAQVNVITPAQLAEALTTPLTFAPHEPAARTDAENRSGRNDPKRNRPL